MLKSSCRAKASKLRTADRLANLIAVFCILGWRVLWLTMVRRATPNAPARIAFIATEMNLLDQLIDSIGNRRARVGSLDFYLIKLARLGAISLAQIMRGGLAGVA